MLYEFLLAFDKAFEYAAPSLDDKQISSFLTKAQWRIFTNTYKPGKDGFGFESTEDNSRDLEQLIRSASISGGTITASATQTGVHPNGTFYDLPSDFYLAIEEAAIIATKEVKVLPIKHDYYTANIYNPYKNPYTNLVWRMTFSRLDQGEDGGDSFTDRTSKRVELIVSQKTTYPIIDYRLRYISLAPDIVCDRLVSANQRHCILQSLVYDIIDEAVKIAVASTKPDEYQVSVNETV